MGTLEEIRSRTLGTADPPLWADADPAQISADRLTVIVSTRKPAWTLVDLVCWIDQLGVELADVQRRRPSLEESRKQQ